MRSLPARAARPLLPFSLSLLALLAAPSFLLSQEKTATTQPAQSLLQNFHFAPAIRQLKFGPEPLGQPAETKPLSEKITDGTSLQTYPWGTLRITAASSPDKTDFQIEITNTGKETLREITIELGQARLPVDPTWPAIHATPFVSPGRLQKLSNVGQPAYLPIEAASPGKTPFGLAWCSPDFDQPLELAWTGKALLWSPTVRIGGDEAVYDDALTTRLIPPGGKDSLRVSLRAWSADPLSSGHDLWPAFRAKHPMLLNWSDRRPISRAFIGAISSPRAGEPTLDRPAAPLLDDKFRARALKLADDALASSLKSNAQGIVIWDVENSQYPNITYVGDPRLTPLLNPQMDLVADEFFKKFTAAGLRVGLTIRPTEIVLLETDGKKSYVHRSNSFRNDPVRLLSDKITYAQKRWGASILYIDTNNFYRPRPGEKEVGSKSGRILSGAQFATLLKLHPDVLLIPEFAYGDAYCSTAQYDESLLGTRSTAPLLRAIWPDCFTTIMIGDGVKDYDTLLSATRGKEVLMFNYELTRQATSALHAREEAALAAATGDLHDKYQRTLKAGASKDASAVPQLLAQLNDPSWPIRRATVWSLGEIADPRAADPLAAVMIDNTACLDYIAGRALARMAAVDSLTKALASPNENAQRAAVEALLAIATPKAADTLVAFITPTDRDVDAQAAAIRALGKIGRTADTAAVLSVLQATRWRRLAFACADALDGPVLYAPNAAAALLARADKEKTDPTPNLKLIASLEKAARTQKPR